MLLALCAILLSPFSAPAMAINHETDCAMSMTAEGECHGHSHRGCNQSSETDCQMACASIAIEAGFPNISDLSYAVDTQLGLRAAFPPGYSPEFEPPPPRSRT